jgi:hypothetical protein
METIEKVVKLKEARDKLQIDLAKLRVMEGRITNGSDEPLCHGIEFMTQYGTHVILKAAFDPEVTIKLVDEAIKLLEAREEELELLLGEVEDALKGLSWDG